MVLMLFPDFPGIMMHHQPVSFNKSTLERVWEKDGELLDATCRHRFREATDINQFVFRYDQLGRGEFSPYNVFKRGDYLTIGNGVDYSKVLNSGYKIICLNDTDTTVDFDTEKKRRYIRNIISDIRNAFKSYGVEDIIINNNKSFYCINKDKISCDYFDYLDGKIDISDEEKESYMEQYPWAEL